MKDFQLCVWSILRDCLYEIKRSCPEVFREKGALRNFTKFKGKHLCQSIFFDKVGGLRPTTLLKKRLWYKCCPVNSVKFLRKPFFTDHLRWLLRSLQCSAFYKISIVKSPSNHSGKKLIVAHLKNGSSNFSKMRNLD